MLPLWRKTMTAALITAAAFGLPGMAHAASPSVQLQLCNSDSQTGTFEITGLNQHNNRVSSPQYSISGRQCRTISNWWWKTGQTVSVAARRTSLNVWHFDIDSNERNGSTVGYSL